MQPEEHTVTHTINRYRSFRYELILEGVVVGALAGAVVVAFRYLIGSADILLNMILDYGRSHTWFVPVWILILAAAACVVSLLLKWDSLISGSGIPQIEGEIIGEIDEKWWRVLLAKLGGGIISLGCGLSLGREGPSIQLGAMTAKGFSRAAKRVKTEEKLLITCGASAGLSAAFNAPIAGILFSLEEVHKHFSPELLLSSMAASITSDFVSRNVFGLTPVFSFHITHMMPLGTYGHVLVLGVLMGAMGVVYNTTLSKTQDLYGKIPWGTVKLLIPFLLAGVFGFTYRSVLGGGHALVEELSTGEMALGRPVPAAGGQIHLQHDKLRLRGAGRHLPAPAGDGGHHRKHILQCGPPCQPLSERPGGEFHHPGHGRLFLSHCAGADYRHHTD